MTTKQVFLEQDSPEWLEWRNSGIGSSDIAKIAGKSPFGSGLDVYYEKVGLSQPKKTNPAMAKGKALEPIIRDRHNQFNAFDKFHPACFERIDYPFMKASLDGYRQGEIIEIKVPNKKDHLDAKDGKIPEAYYIQMQWQMFVSETSLATYISFHEESNTTYMVIVHRCEATIGYLKKAAIEFWDCVTKRQPPEKTLQDIDFITDDAFLIIALNAQKIKKEIDRLEQEWKDIKPKILEFGNGRSFSGYGIMAALTKGRTSYDIEAMRADGIDVDKYKRQGDEFYTIKIDK